MGDDTVPMRGEQPEPEFADVGHAFGDPVEVDRAGEEAEEARLGREALHEVPDRVAILRPDWANMHRRAVPEGDV
jgi:hypothetical protein